MLQDLRFAIRTLFRSPGFTTTAAVTLALGIGVTSLMFSVVNAVLLRPLPYPDQDRLMLVFNVNSQCGRSQHDPRRRRSTSRTTAPARAVSRRWPGISAPGFTFSGQGEPELVIGQTGDAGLLQGPGRPAGAGPHVRARRVRARPRRRRIVLSQRLWTRRFGGSPSVVGTRVTVNGKPYTIVGRHAGRRSTIRAAATSCGRRCPSLARRICRPPTAPRTTCRSSAG